MKSIFSEFQLRKKLLEALGWQIVGHGMWSKSPDTQSPDERVDEDVVLEIEQKRIEGIQVVFEALSDIADDQSESCGDPGVEGPTGMVDGSGPQGTLEEKLLDLANRVVILQGDNRTIVKRIEALELSNTAWRGVNGRLTTVEEQIKMIFNVFESLRLAVMAAIKSAYITSKLTTKNEKTTAPHSKRKNG